MATYSVPDTGREVTCGATVDTVNFLVPGNWVVTNTGTHDGVINMDAATAPTRTQPAGAGGRYLPPGASASIPPTCSSVTIQDASDGSTTLFLFSKG